MKLASRFFYGADQVVRGPHTNRNQRRTEVFYGFPIGGSNKKRTNGQWDDVVGPHSTTPHGTVGGLFPDIPVVCSQTDIGRRAGCLAGGQILITPDISVAA